uniref:Uncharacterized protein n=1 Tax=Myotis myotis TaxID=51298 RepID=A0A7J7XHI0_MYOMY|nr:hypothetical protein mMyoMyo1_011733 [Myotis myotis]
MTHPRLQSHLPLPMSTSNPCALRSLSPSGLWEMEISESLQTPSSLLRNSPEIPRAQPYWKFAGQVNGAETRGRGRTGENGSAAPPPGSCKHHLCGLSFRRGRPLSPGGLRGRSGQMEPAHETSRLRGLRAGHVRCPHRAE